jgi:hypothetical protein
MAPFDTCREYHVASTPHARTHARTHALLCPLPVPCLSLAADVCMCCWPACPVCRYICNDDQATIGTQPPANRGGISVGEYNRPGSTLPPDQFDPDQYHLYELVYNPRSAGDANAAEHGVYTAPAPAPAPELIRARMISVDQRLVCAIVSEPLSGWALPCMISHHHIISYRII